MPDRAYRNAAVAEFEAALRRTTATEAIPYIELFSPWTADQAYRQRLFDGIHPNAAGHAQICERLKAFLQRQGLGNGT
jgi:lysophospholipase L1-like esterase